MKKKSIKFNRLVFFSFLFFSLYKLSSLIKEQNRWKNNASHSLKSEKWYKVFSFLFFLLVINPQPFRPILWNLDEPRIKILNLQFVLQSISPTPREAPVLFERA